MTNTCPQCARPCGDAYVCKDCTRTAINNLRHIADLAAAFDEKRAKVKSSWDVSNLGASKPALKWRTSDNQTVTHAAKSTFTPGNALHFDPRVGRVRDRTQNALVGIARTVLEHHDDGSLSRDAEPADIARWLIGQVKWLRLQPEAGETWKLISDIVTDLHGLFDNPPPALFLGECKAEFEEGECTESIYLDREKVTGDTVSCPHCGITHDIAERRGQLMAGVDDYLGTVKEISRLLRNIGGSDVSEHMIKNYATRGMLTKMGSRREHDKAGKPRDAALYRIGQVREVVQMYQLARERRRSHRHSLALESGKRVS